jgi:multisubunit Na+/H+ antiporter MnhG subunit
LIIRILSFNHEIQKYIDNQYSRLRIARATVCNLPLITIAVCCFAFNNVTSLKLSLCATIFGISGMGTLLTVLSIIGWYRRKNDYFRYVKETKIIIDKAEKNG